MFDTLYCKVLLPAGSPFDSTYPFQTKDLECVMNTYVIEEDGRLMVKAGYYEDIPLAERPYPNADDWKKLIGSMRFVETGWEPVDVHQRVVFYGNTNGVWYDYEATFTHGRLESLVLKHTELMKGPCGGICQE